MTLLGLDDSTDAPAPGRLSLPVLCSPPEPAEHSWPDLPRPRLAAGGTSAGRRPSGLLAVLGRRVPEPD